MDNKATKKNSERLDKDDIEYQRMQAIFFKFWREVNCIKRHKEQM